MRSFKVFFRNRPTTPSAILAVGRHALDERRIHGF
jgi:hypothetical protein